MNVPILLFSSSLSFHSIPSSFTDRFKEETIFLDTHTQHKQFSFFPIHSFLFCSMFVGMEGKKMQEIIWMCLWHYLLTQSHSFSPSSIHSILLFQTSLKGWKLESWMSECWTIHVSMSMCGDQMDNRVKGKIEWHRRDKHIYIYWRKEKG